MMPLKKNLPAAGSGFSDYYVPEEKFLGPPSPKNLATPLHLLVVQGCYSFLCLYSQSHSIWQVFVSLDRHDFLLWHRHRGPVPGARPGSDQPQRHQKGRRRALPQIPHGNTINDSIQPATRRRRQGRFHQMALHDITHLGRISHRKMDP